MTGPESGLIIHGKNLANSGEDTPVDPELADIDSIAQRANERLKGTGITVTMHRITLDADQMHPVNAEIRPSGIPGLNFAQITFEVTGLPPDLLDLSVKVIEGEIIPPDTIDRIEHQQFMEAAICQSFSCLIQYVLA